MSQVADIGTSELVSRLRRLEAELRASGVTRLAIFGSRARGHWRAGSDLDVLIDVDSGRKFSLLDLVGVAHVIEDSVGISANIFMRRSLEPDFVASIRPDIVEIF